jgi:MoaA/NifB/PqqE/SkfB family radical SAM enzyme
VDQPFPDIPLEQWKAVIDRLHSWGVRMFSLTGGEPLVRSDILEIVDYISHDKKAVVWMISNFKSMDESTIDRLRRAGLQFLTCSLDSLLGQGEKSDDKTLDLLVYAREQGIIASTLTVVTRDNIGQVPAIAREVVSRGLLFDMGLFQHVGGAFSPEDSGLKPQSMSKLKDVLTSLKRLKIATGRVSPSISYLSENLSLYESMGWKCPADADRFLVVNNNGTLMACQEYPGEIGVLDIKDLGDPVWRAWKSETVLGCNGCFYGCYYQKCRITPIDALFDAYAMLKT